MLRLPLGMRLAMWIQHRKVSSICTTLVFSNATTKWAAGLLGIQKHTSPFDVWGRAWTWDSPSLSAPHILTPQDSIWLVYFITGAEFVSWFHCDPSSRVSLTQFPSSRSYFLQKELPVPLSFVGSHALVGQALGGSWASLQVRLQFKGFITQVPHSSPDLLWPPSVTLQPKSGRVEPIFNRGRTFCISLQSLSATSLHKAPEELRWPFCLGKPANPYRCFPERCSDQGSGI